MAKNDKPTDNTEPGTTSADSVEGTMSRKDIKAKAIAIVKKVRDEAFYLATCREARVCVSCGADVGKYEKQVEGGPYAKEYEQKCEACGYLDKFKIQTVEPQKYWYEDI